MLHLAALSCQDTLKPDNTALWSHIQQVSGLQGKKQGRTCKLLHHSSHFPAELRNRDVLLVHPIVSLQIVYATVTWTTSLTLSQLECMLILTCNSDTAPLQADSLQQHGKIAEHICAVSMPQGQGSVPEPACEPSAQAGGNLGPSRYKQGQCLERPLRSS